MNSRIDKEKIGENLKKIRVLRGLTQKKLADKIGIKQQTVQQIESGKILPTLDITSKMSSYFGMSFEDLLLVNKDAELLNLGVSTNNKESKGINIIPLIPMQTLSDIISSETMPTDQDYEKYVIPIFGKCDFILSVSGGVSAPHECNIGDLIACKKLKSWTFFQYGRIYVLQTSQGPIVRRVEKSKHKDMLLISGGSKEQPTAEFDLPIKEITSVAIVIGSIKLC